MPHLNVFWTLPGVVILPFSWAAWISLSLKKFFLTPNLDLSWHNLRQFVSFCAITSYLWKEADTHPTTTSFQVFVEINKVAPTIIHLCTLYCKWSRNSNHKNQTSKNFVHCASCLSCSRLFTSEDTASYYVFQSELIYFCLACCAPLSFSPTSMKLLLQM